KYETEDLSLKRENFWRDNLSGWGGSTEKTEITEHTEVIKGISPFFFRMFRYFRLFRTLFFESGYCHSPSLTFFLILRLSRSRLTGLRNSIKSLPLMWSVSCSTQRAARPSASKVNSLPSMSMAETVTISGRSTSK